ncbi:hypothetical protein EOS93_23225 [Rhizobium sp. RMa-01]|uniref:hypothetical protein n=1 Tax=unclassified Rhizobium TaxID=2613769 RepID=UPI0008DACAE5|nr:MULTISPECIES: hypothetical protein [unclassified Rhizobium]OHV25217.1 hypothetical protein BBJ66_21430 [Rhizobium sp. RSm-3]RVU08405.1 hypothetical protein EOS93_23225 [Rhizobium sp. RMa-01]
MRSFLTLAFGVVLTVAPANASAIQREEAIAVGEIMTASGECMDMNQTSEGETLAEVVFAFAKHEPSLSDLVEEGQDSFQNQIKTEGRVRACADVIRRYPDLLMIENQEGEESN